MARPEHRLGLLAGMSLMLSCLPEMSVMVLVFLLGAGVALCLVEAMTSE